MSHPLPPMEVPKTGRLLSCVNFLFFFYLINLEALLTSFNQNIFCNIQHFPLLFKLKDAEQPIKPSINNFLGAQKLADLMYMYRETNDYSFRKIEDLFKSFTK